MPLSDFKEENAKNKKSAVFFISLQSGAFNNYCL